jgi:hypothetical protein
VNDYSTTLIGLLNGTPVYSMTFLAPFSDSSLTTAIATADGILAADGASFGSPSLSSSTSLLLSSVVTPASTYTCASAEATGSTYLTGSTNAVTTNFGPGPFSAGDCDAGTFTLLAGQVDTNVDTDNQYNIPVQAITTNTYLTSQTYEIAGTTNTVPAQTPEPASLELALTGLGAIGWLRPRHTGN